MVRMFNFDRRSWVTTDRDMVSVTLLIRGVAMAVRDGFSVPCRAGTTYRGAHDDLDIVSGSAADVRRGFDSRPPRAVALVA